MVLRVARSPSSVHSVSLSFSLRVARISARRIYAMNWMKFLPWGVTEFPVLNRWSADFLVSNACTVNHLPSYIAIMSPLDMFWKRSITNIPVMLSLYKRAFFLSIRTAFLLSALISKYFVALPARYCPCPWTNIRQMMTSFWQSPQSRRGPTSFRSQLSWLQERHPEMAQGRARHPILCIRVRLLGRDGASWATCSW